MMADFLKLVPDLTEDDIDGSTYAIEDYTVDPVIGGADELKALRHKLSSLGMRLMLDFIPNHFGAHTHFIHDHPEYFIEIDGANNQKFSSGTSHWQNTFYHPIAREDSIFAHGKDPYFDAWQDTIQINYGSEGARSWMTTQLLKIASLCDGVRCDMAMLQIKNIFVRTWHDIITWHGDEFWPVAIRTTKKSFPNFTLLAEVYWDMEAELLEAGFDYCYDKTFYDRLNEPASLNAHYHAEGWYLQHTARFLENHDEERIVSRLDLRQHMAAAALVAFGPGMRFWHMGQWEGRAKRIPVQITRQPEESCGCFLHSINQSGCACVEALYHNLFEIANQDIFKYGNWQRIDTNTDLYPGLFLWKWEYKKKQVVIAINYYAEEIVLDIKNTALSNLNFENLTLPAIEDSYHSAHFRAWDVRVWSG